MSTTQSFLAGVKEYGRALEFIRKNADVKSNAKIIEILKVTNENEYNLSLFTQFIESKENSGVIKDIFYQVKKWIRCL